MKILSFGEILWDVFPDEKVIGGAPFNFAAHSAKLGACSYLVSCVGNDENGFDAIDKAKSYGIKCDYISIDRKHQTGISKITLANGKPSYEIVGNVAFDHIPDTCIHGSFDAIYMGTLALRSNESRRSFEKILKYTDKKEVFFDVNFRQSFYSRELVKSLLRETTILKISDEEIGFFGNRDYINVCLDIAANNKKLKYILLTLGSEGAMIYDCRKRTVLFSDKPECEVVSTVGAGDSFSACFLVSLLSGLPISDCLDNAVKLSSFVVTRLEAVPEYKKEDFFVF
jgi:fructokinase